MSAPARSGGNRRRPVTPKPADDDDPFGEGDQLAARRAKRGDADVAGMRGRDRAYAEAYRAGAAGQPAPADADDATRQAWETGAEDRASPPRDAPATSGGGAHGAAATPAGVTGRLAARSPLPIPTEPGGFLLGVLGYTLALNFLQGGPGQVRAWLSAKFTNKAAGAAASSASASTRPSSASSTSSGGIAGGMPNLNETVAAAMAAAKYPAPSTSRLGSSAT